MHLPTSKSLKAKRSVVQSAVRTLDGWHGVAAAEVGALDKWQIAELGIAVVSGSPAHTEQTADRIERYLWALPEAEVIEIDRTWVEDSNG